MKCILCITSIALAIGSAAGLVGLSVIAPKQADRVDGLDTIAPSRTEIIKMLRELDVQVDVAEDGKVDQIGPVDYQWGRINDRYPEMERWIASRFPNLKRDVIFALQDRNGMRVCRRETLWVHSK